MQHISASVAEGSGQELAAPDFLFVIGMTEQRAPN